MQSKWQRWRTGSRDDGSKTSLQRRETAVVEVSERERGVRSRDRRV
jgi:hypothetical protein